VRKVGGYVITPLSATIPRPSSRRGRLWCNQMSTESGEGQIIAQTGSPLYSEGGRADPQLRASSGIPSLTPSHAMRKDSQLILTIPFQQYRIIT
jgi:hypothetical protein